MFSTNLTRMPSSKIQAASIQNLLKALATLDPKKAKTPVVVNPEPKPQTMPLAADYTYTNDNGKDTRMSPLRSPRSYGFPVSRKV